MANLDFSAGFSRTLGLDVEAVGPDEVVASFEVRPEHLQPHGILHGGVHCTVVETVASIGASTWLGDRGVPVGVANQTDFLRAVRSGRLSSRATPVFRGRTQQLWAVETRDQEGRLVARGQLRMQNLVEPPADRG